MEGREHSGSRLVTVHRDHTKRTGQSPLFAEDKEFSEVWAEWKGMPDFDMKDLMPFMSVLVHFATQEDADAFAKLVGQPLKQAGKRSPTIWYPKASVLTSIDKRYIVPE